MSAREKLEGRLEAEKVCTIILETSRTPEEARRRMKNLLLRLMLHLQPN